MTAEKGKESGCCILMKIFLCVVLAAIVTGGFIWLWKIDEDRRLHSQPAEYYVAITGVAGLGVDDVAGDRHPTLSPVFNLTLRVSNTRDYYSQACVSDLSMASVFYGDAFLGKGSVEPFCAEPKEEREGRGRAWGQDVTLPGFLRDQLAAELRRGDAAVDVKVKMPSGCTMEACFDMVFICRAKIRGGSPCLMRGNLVQSQH